MTGARDPAVAGLGDIVTPALILDRCRLAHNSRRMLARAQDLGVSLRPHVKTSKSIDVLRVMAGGQAKCPITVSTLAEARYFFEQGIDDIFYAVGIAPVRLPEVVDLLRRGCRLTILLDSVEAARAVGDFGKAANLDIPALIEIDSDGHRAGVVADDPALIAIGKSLAGSPGARLAGVLTHAGASYGCRTKAEFEAMAERERSSAVAAAARLRDAGLDCPVVSVGSTPTIHYARSLEGVTEARAGVYAFGDLVQAQLGTCRMDDIAIGVLSSVIGHKKAEGRLLVDAGFLALSRDRGTADLPVDFGFGAVCDPVSGARLGDCIVSATNQEHGIVTSPSGRLDFDRLPVGAALLILPNHACATAAAHQFYHVLGPDRRREGVWARINGW